MSEPSTAAKNAGPRTLVIFADGTGNAFSQRETNIWRLYCALDKRSEDQLARYLPGVGTSSISVLRWLDAAIGFGVPANVRKLYRFLCWNWRPGDRIVLIGFSRGAFTVRTLAGLIAYQGLMPRDGGTGPVTTAQMRRNARGAWRAYRAASVPRKGPVRLWRAIGTACVTLKRRLLGQQLHPEVELAQPESRSPVRRRDTTPGTDPFATSAPTAGVMVDFMGVFDTVEAFGLPIDELRRPIGVLFYPLTFANTVCAASVRRARHALAVDEERQTFLAVRFDRSGKTRQWQDIAERWFPGVHSDIGGGYPDDHNAMAPLRWMTAELQGIDIRFLGRIAAEIDSRQFPAAPIHNSRSGFAAAYRYQPREVGRDDQADPVLQDKICDTLDGYAPISLPAGCRIAGGGRQGPMAAPADQRVVAMIFRRRLLNRILVLVLMFFVLAPWFDPPPVDGPARQSLLQAGWKMWWINGALHSGTAGIIAALLGLVGWLGNLNLEERIHDTAARGWQGKTRGMQRPSRLARWLGGLDRRWLDGVFVLVLMAMVATVLGQQAGRIGRALSAGAHCVAPAALPEPGRGLRFDPARPCMALGRVQAGRRYLLSLSQDRAFCDAHIPAPVAGFASTRWWQSWSEAARRMPDAPWFAPLVQVGRDGAPIRLQDAAADDRAGPGGGSTCRADGRRGGRMLATITAPADGPLFLYVNDIRVLPGIFYANNSGAARVELTAAPD